VITAGIDLAAEPKATALALIEWGKNQAELQLLSLGVADEQIVGLAKSADKIGIDCAFGWPVEFFEFLAQSPDADYPYRVFVEQEAFAQWAFEQAMNVEYNNFKNKVAKSRGYEFASALGNVWVAMLKVEDEQARTNEKTEVPDVTQEDRDNAKKGYPNQTFSDKDLEMLKALGHL
jgi:hypothetical protein